jgi:hypothetical protein
MPRLLTLRHLKKATAILTMAVVSLCGGGKAPLEPRSSIVAVEGQRNSVSRSVVAASQVEVVARAHADDAASPGSDRVLIASNELIGFSVALNTFGFRLEDPAGRTSYWIRPPSRAPPTDARNG